MSLAARQLTLGGMVRTNAVLHAARPALMEGAARITHEALHRRTDALAGALDRAGLRQGDRLGLLLVDSIPTVELFIAAGKLGAIAVMLNFRLAAPEIAGIVADADCAIVIHSERFAPLVPPGVAAEALPDDYSEDRRYGEWLAAPPPARFPAVRGDDPAYMMFTSGTTGKPKGCLQSHEGIVVSALGFATRRALTPDDVNLSTLPLFHVAGLSHVTGLMAAGGSSVIVRHDTAPEALMDLAVEEGCTIATLSQPLMQARAAAGERSRSALRLRSITGSAGMTAPAKFAWVREEWGAEFVGGWGQTEVGGFGTAIDFEDMLENPASIGWPMPSFDMAIIDGDGRELSADEEGEIAVRGASVTLGYWRNPQASEDALGTGWLRTGDLGRRDARGLFYLLGRAKELIKTGGENVYPAEVEAVLLGLPAVADAAVCGVKDRRWGEAVKACVVLKPGARLDKAEMTAACRAAIAGYKRPRYLEIVSSIPRDSLGKVQRRELSARPVTPDQAVD